MTKLIFWRDPRTGVVFSEYENPVGAWTPEEWQAEINRLQAELAQIETMLADLVPPKEWPEDAKAYWLETRASELGDLQHRRQELADRIAMMETVDHG